MNKSINTRTQQKQKQHNDYWQQQQTGSTAVVAATRSSSGGAAVEPASYQVRASEPPIVRLMTPCLGGCALTYASTRGVHTHKVNESLNTLHTVQATTAQIICSSSSRQAQQQPATSERASYRPFADSVPWWLRIVWLSRVLCVVCRLCCVTCALCCLLAISCYMTYIRGHVCNS